MPYIKGTDRVALDKHLDYLIEELILDKDLLTISGQLNYCIYRLVLGCWKKFKSYPTISVVTGVLDNVKSEFYRVHAVEYEQKKIRENGDITI